jgi:hypothetical protein
MSRKITLEEDGRHEKPYFLKKNSHHGKLKLQV